jgi:hypothetical protein
MNEDFADLLRALLKVEARFLVVGAYALAVHGVPRATGDLDVWVEATSKNAAQVWKALIAFGAPVEDLAVSVEDLHAPDVVVQIGLPPRRIDLLTSVTGVAFEEAWAERTLHEVTGVTIPFLGRRALIANKRATARLQDLADLEALGEEPLPPS